MPSISQIEVAKLSLDLKNYRTVPQKKEVDAINAMITISQDRFVAIINSIIDNGYISSENIIVLNNGSKITVKEGNRRIAALKLIHGIHKVKNFSLPASTVKKIEAVDDKWKKANAKVSCMVFKDNEEDKANQVVDITHGKGEAASRDPWNSVAHARHNKIVNKRSEPGLDLLEKYLKDGKNVNGAQKERWAGDYPLTILNEAMSKLYVRSGCESSVELAKKYPSIVHRNEWEEIIYKIGLGQVKFENIRATSPDFGSTYGINPPMISTNPSGDATSQTTQNTTNSTGTIPATNIGTSNTTNSVTNTNSTNTTNTTPPTTSGTTSTKSTSATTNANTGSKAYAINDPKQVKATWKKFNPRGVNRQKVVTLKEEIKGLDISKNPIAFCFLLRSMFEISAKAYCTDKSIPTQKNGKDKTLVEMLRAVTNDITSNNTNQAQMKILHGALTEIAKHDGILSVTSMNQLVHNPKFSVQPPDICTLFGNIYPLLEAMN